MDDLSTIAKTCAPVIPRLYEDAASPVAKEAGVFLGRGGKFLNALLSRPVDVVSNKLNAFWNSVDAEATERIQRIPPEQRVEPKMGHMIALYHGLETTVDSPTMKGLFLNLLQSSFDKNLASEVLPAYPETLKQMNPDEAKILCQLYRLGGQAPIIEARLTQRQNKAHGWRLIQQNFSLLAVETGCQAPQNGAVYVDNLRRLGLVDITYMATINDETLYQHIEKYFFNSNKNIQVPENYEISFERGLIRLTEFGKGFCKVCAIADATN